MRLLNAEQQWNERRPVNSRPCQLDSKRFGGVFFPCVFVCVACNVCCDVTGGCAVGETLITLRETSSSAQASRGQSWEAEPRVVAQYDLKKAKRQVGTNEYFTARRHRQRCGQK